MRQSYDIDRAWFDSLNIASRYITVHYANPHQADGDCDLPLSFSTTWS